MPTYTINGRTVRTTKPLTDDEIDEIAATLPTQAGVTPKELSKVFQRNRPQDTGVTPGQYLTDVAKGSVARFVPQIMRAVAGMEAPLQTPSAEPSLTQQIEKQFIQPVEQRTQQAVGYQQIPAPDKASRLVGAGLESTLDLLSMLSGGGRIVPTLLGGFIPGMTAEFGGQVGQNIAGDPGQFVGALTGGITGGLGQSQLGFRAAKLGYDRFAPKIQQAKQRISGTVPEEEIQREASGAVENILRAAADADPNIAANIQRADEIARTTGVQLPATAILNSNPVLVDQVRSLAARDPVFRSQYGQQFEQAQQALEGRATRLFGQPATANAIIEQTVRDIPLDKVQQRRLDALNKQIAKESSFNVADQQQLGSRVKKLVETKEDAAREATSPLYDSAFDFAKQNNIVLPANSVEDIYTFANQKQAADVFGTFPSLWNKINKHFSPNQETQLFNNLDISYLDSLKQAVNKALRSSNDPKELRLLGELRTKVDDAIYALPEEFSTRYKAADAAFRENVGLPYNQEAIKQVDRAKFDETVLPVLTKNRSALSQFLAATGSEGFDLAKKAFIIDFDKAAIKDGVIDPKAASKWLKENNPTLSLLGTRADDVRLAISDVTALNAEKVRINSAFTEAKKNKLLQLEGKTAQEIVSGLYSKPANVDQFLRTYGSNVDTLNAVRSFMLDDVLSATDPIAALTDRTRKATYDKVFGPTYIKNVESLAEASRRLADNPANVKFNVQEVPKTEIERITGTTPESIASQVRDRFTSAPYVVTSLLSKFWAKQTAEATDAQLKTLLLNPQEVKKLSQAFTPKADGSLDLTKVNSALKSAQKFGVNLLEMAINDAAMGAVRATPAIQANMPEEMQ
jgi:hypothetical protein